MAKAYALAIDLYRRINRKYSLMNTLINNDANKNRLFRPALLISALFLLIPAFYNHYPLVNPDTATYLASGFKPETPFDRPITYGLLIRLFSLNGLSLWLVVYIQALIVSWLVFKIIWQVAAKQFYIPIGMGVILFLSVFTSLSWIVSQVQPDVFTPIALLCIIPLLVGNEEKKTEIFLYLLFFVAVAVHLSHPLLFTMILVCMLFLKKYFIVKEEYRQTNKKIVILISLSLASIIVMGSALSKSKHVFFVGSLLEKGVLEKYLDDNCATKNYRICAYKDSLPLRADDFWWQANSPLYKIGDWNGTKAEFNDIIHHILTTPKYLKLYLQATVKQSWAQACRFNIGDGNVSFPAGSNVNNRVLEYFPREISQFNKSEQNSVPHFWFLLIAPNTIFVIVFYVCIVTLLFIFIRWKRVSSEMRLIFMFSFSGIILNIIDCAAFGTANGRYGCKMMWLLPFCVILYLLSKRNIAK